MRSSGSARTEVAQLISAEELDNSLMHLAYGDSDYNKLQFAKYFAEKVFDVAFKDAVERRIQALKDARFERDYPE